VTEDDLFDAPDVTDDPTADLDRATQQLSVRTESRRYDKPVTVVEGFESGADVDDLASDLKSMLGAGGTVKESAVEIQGDHESRVRDELRDRGYQVDG